MAIYRNVSMSFWTDSKVIDDFTPKDKFFMLYCLTNPYTNLCGCYEISIKQMTRDTGYNEETINRLLDRLSRSDVIKYNKTNKELYITNWFKYNWTKSEKLDKPLLEEIKKIKTKEFKEKLSDLYNKRDTVSIPYRYPMDRTVSVSDTITDTNIYKEVIDYLNFKTNSNYKHTTKKTKDLIKARINERFTLEDFKKVIDNKCEDWKNTDLAKYLRPETLFGTKFEGYLNQKKELPDWFDKNMRKSSDNLDELNEILEDFND